MVKDDQIYERRIRSFATDTSAVMLFNILLLGFSFSAQLSQMILGFFYVFVFFVPLLFWNGQTFGKRSQKIKIVGIDGRELPTWKILLREVVKMGFIILTFGLYIVVGALMISKNGQQGTLHDRLFHTKIISTTPNVGDDVDTFLMKTPSARERGL